LEYGCELKIVTEEYTSMCCSNCGMLSDNYKKRMKTCPYCKLSINRDVNGSRNILIKNSLGNYKCRS
jgi:transposase